MARTVKTLRGAGAGAGARRSSVGKSTISSKHQVTIAKNAFDEAGLHAGDVVTIRAVGPGWVEMTSLDALFARFRGRLTGGDQRRRQIDRERDEWA